MNNFYNEEKQIIDRMGRFENINNKGTNNNNKKSNE